MKQLSVAWFRQSRWFIKPDKHRRSKHVCCAWLVGLALVHLAPAGAAENTASSSWIERSNTYSHILVEALAQFRPERYSSEGLPQFNTHTIDLGSGYVERKIAAIERVRTRLAAALERETDVQVRRDLQILINAAEEIVVAMQLERQYFLPNFDVSEYVYYGLEELLGDKTTAERKKAALIRLNRYAGLATGTQPLTVLAERNMREVMSSPGKRYPSRQQLERQLAATSEYLAGIKELFVKARLPGWQRAYARLTSQLAQYDAFLRREVLPKATTDFRLPAAVYAFRLRREGVAIPVEALIARAHRGFSETQEQLRQLAQQIDPELGSGDLGYCRVIGKLRSRHLAPEAVLKAYRERISKIEQIIERENLVSLPRQQATVKLASKTEEVDAVSPYYQLPPLLNNRGERGQFVIPLQAFSTTGSAGLPDFTHEAATWVFSAHESRPGHDLQVSRMIEQGLSYARASFAYTTANMEGWALYSEWLIYPYMPPEGQLIALQLRLQRAARAFLDPELHRGEITPAEAQAVLTQQVCFSETFARQEVERYTFRWPVDPAVYWYGFTELLQLRKDAEAKLGSAFNAKAFHDFILSQGLMAPTQIKKAVFEQFALEKIKKANCF